MTINVEFTKLEIQTMIAVYEWLYNVKALIVIRVPTSGSLVLREIRAQSPLQSS